MLKKNVMSHDMCHESSVACLAYFLSYASKDCIYVSVSRGLVSWGAGRHNRQQTTDNRQQTDITTYQRACKDNTVILF